MKKYFLHAVVFIVILAIGGFVIGCGGGPTNSVIPNTNTPIDNTPTSPTDPTPTSVPTGNMTITVTDANGNTLGGYWIRYSVLMANGRTINSSDLTGSYNTSGQQQVDSNGLTVITNIPLHNVVRVEVASTSDFTDISSARNITYNTDGQTETMVQNQNEPTPSDLTPYPTQAPTSTPAPDQPTNTPAPTQTPGGPTATNTPASTNTPIAPTQTPGGPTATNTPASTNTPTPAPGATNTPTPSSSNPSITNVKKTSETGWDESMVETGTEVSIIGTNFGATQGTVTIGGYSATINSWTDTLIKVVVPAGALTGTGENKVVQITTAGSKTASWDELFVNSNLQTLLTKAYSSKEAVFNSDASILYDIAGKSVYGYNFPSMTPLSPASVLFSSEANFGCYCNENNRLYLSAADINSCNSTLGDKTMVTSIYSNSEGIRWNPVLKKLFLVVGETLYSFKTDGTSHQSHYTDPVALTGIDIDSDGYIYLTALNKVKTLKPDLTLESNQVEVGLGCYIYCKKINSSIKLLFVTAEEGGLSVIDVIKIKDNTTKTIIKKIKGFTAAQVLSGIHGHEGKVVVVDENMKKIHLMLF